MERTLLVFGHLYKEKKSNGCFKKNIIELSAQSSVSHLFRLKKPQDDFGVLTSPVRVCDALAQRSLSPRRAISLTVPAWQGSVLRRVPFHACPSIRGEASAPCHRWHGNMTGAWTSIPKGCRRIRSFYLSGETERSFSSGRHRIWPPCLFYEIGF